MAISPTIPTSFVPKQPLDAPRRKQSGGSNILLLISLIILGASVLSAGAVFGYQKYLESVVELKAAELATAEAEINRETVELYLRLESRFSAARELLDKHTAVSQFLTALEDATLVNVRFSSLSLTVAEDRTAEVQLDGVARNFNTLAAQSNAIAADKRFKRAIFSNIAIQPNSTSVGFSLTADIAPELIVMQPPAAEEPAPAPVETGTTTAPAPTTGL